MRKCIARLLGGLLLAAGSVSAQTYPAHPIRIITGGAGGGSDFVSRLVAQGISPVLGQPVLVVNYPTGVTSGETVMKAIPDGHTLLVSGPLLWIGPFLRPAPYDPVKDFAGVAMLVAAPSVVVVTPSLPVANVKELIELAKAKPGQLNYASAGTGTQAHLAAELFKYMAGVNLQGISYSVVAMRLAELFSGQVHVAIDDGLMTHVKSGKLRGLAVTSAQRSVLAPGLPTVAESGLPGYESSLRTGMFAPAKTPEAVVRRLNQEVVRFLNLPETRARLLEFGTEAVASSPQELGATLVSEREKFSKVLAVTGITAH